MKNIIFRKMLTTTILVGAFSTPFEAARAAEEGATPQAPAQEQTGGALQEIIVTAQKRSESQQDVPISVAVVGQMALQQSGVSNIGELRFKVPNLTLAESGIGTALGIRGIFSGVNQGFEQSVGVFIDGVHYGRAQQARSPFFDVERVEVLRGPQSILFGKNAIAGALNITTAAPADRFGGYAVASYGTNADDYETTVALTGPVSDGVRVRLAGRYRNADGYMHNLTLDRPEAQREEWQLRGTIEADLASNLTLTVKGEAGSFDVTGRENEIVGELPAALPASNPAAGLVNGLTYAQILTNSGDVPVNTRIAAVNAATGMELRPLPVADASVLNNRRDQNRSSNGDFSSNKAQAYMVKLDWQTGLGTVSAISGYNRFKSNELCDCDFTGAPILDAPLKEKYSQFSQEVRLVSDKGGQFDYILGAFFQTSRDRYADRIEIGAGSPLVPLVFNQAYGPAFEAAAQGWLAANPGDVAGAVGAGRAAGNQAGTIGLALADTQAARSARVDAKVWSVFGQIAWHISDDLRLTFGSRLQYEKKDGRRTMAIEARGGGALQGQQALLTPIAYAALFGIASQNLSEIAAAGIPGISTSAGDFVNALGALPTAGDYSQWRYTPSLTLQYDAGPHTMVYASWVTGAKSGGFDYRANNKGAAASMDEAFAFGDEKAMTVEGGLKTRLLGGRAELNAAVYYTDYKDLQVSIFDGRLGFNVGNAAKARIYGLELDGRVRITPRLSANGSFAYTNFKFKEFPYGQCYSGQVPNGPAAAQGYCSYKGQTAQFVPKTTGTLALQYMVPITDALEIRASGDMFYSGKYFADPTLDPRLVQRAYTRFNARLALGSVGPKKWEVALLAKNLTDKKPMSFATAVPLAYDIFGAVSSNAFFGEGRTFVLQGRFDF